jgi:hypothetical protein
VRHGTTIRQPRERFGTRRHHRWIS